MCYAPDNKDFRWRNEHEDDCPAIDHVYLVACDDRIGLAVFTCYSDTGWQWESIKYNGVIDCINYYGGLGEGQSDTFTPAEIEKWCPIPSFTLEAKDE